MADFASLILRDDLAAIKRELPLEPTLIDGLSPEGLPLIFLAARVCGLPTLQYLVEYGLRVNLNAVDSQGRDLLHHAAWSGDVAKCRYLVERGGMDILRGDKTLETPYDIARRMGHQALEAYFAEKTGVAYEHLYRNPIRRGFFPDPSIVRVGEDYYMVNSTFIYFPCIPVSHSRDLVHWEIIGHAIENPAWAHLEGLEGGRGYWAPDISYYNGRFYICATLRLNDTGAVRRRQMVVTATRPEGPYSEPVFFEEDGIDPSIFHDEDGRHYMLLNRGARIFEIDETATRRLSDATLLYYGSQKRAPEGPHLLKHNGWYYLFEAEGGTGMGHRETVARSRTLHGIYEPSPYNPVIRQNDERAPLQCCGHAKPVSTPDGRWYFVYLCARSWAGQWSFLGRETALDPFTWTADGWPLLNQGRGISVMNRLPLPAAPFAGEKTDWLTPRPPAPGQFRWQGDCLILHGGPYSLHDTRCRSLLLRRQTDFAFTFSARLTVPERGEAGMTCYYDENSFFTWGVRDGALALTEQIGAQILPHPEVAAPLAPGRQVVLSVRCAGLERRLLLDGREIARLTDTAYLASEGLKMGKRFTGAMTGLYALSCDAVFTAMQYAAENQTGC